MSECKWATRAFDNELGRPIRVEVATGLGGVTNTRVTMVGPDTVDEGFMTTIEAMALRDALNEAFPVAA